MPDRTTSSDRNLRRARNSGIMLTEIDVARILGMHARGDRQHDIAAYHGVDSARVSEVVKGRKFDGVSPMPSAALPSPGPYVVLDRAMTDELRAALGRHYSH